MMVFATVASGIDSNIPKQKIAILPTIKEHSFKPYS